MRKMIFCLIVFVTASSLALAATYSPSIRWREQKTEHFVFVYSNDLSAAQLQRIQTLAEEEYQTVTRFLQSEVKSKIYFVISDQTDGFNGSTTVIPQNRVEIFLTPALNGDAAVLWDTRTQDYLRLLIHHELVHAVQINARGGVFRFLHAVFGPLFSPNLFLPPNFLEGLAVYSETTGWQGRGAGSFYDMVLRTDMLTGNAKKLDEVMVYSRPWLQGARVYLYGYKFLEHLAKTRGEAKLAELVRAAGSRFPLFVTGAFAKVYGRSVHELWRDWQKTLPDFYEKQKRDLLEDGETRATALFESGGFANHLALSPDQRTLYFQWRGIDNAQSLVALDLQTLQKRVLSQGAFVGRISVTADGRKLYYAKQDVYRQVSLVGDLYVYDLARHNEKRLTHGERVTDVAVAPDAAGVFYVTVVQGVSHLRGWNFATGEKIEMPKPHDVLIWHDPVFLPDNSALLLLGQNRAGQDRIYVWEQNSQEWQVIAPQAGWLGDLSASPSSDEIYFTSDQNGTPNVHSYHFKTGLQQRRTSVWSGAFAGVAGGEGLYYSEFSSRGFVIKKTPLASRFGRKVKLKTSRAVLQKEQAVPSVTDTDAAEGRSGQRYHPLRQLFKPYSLWPILTSDEEGFRAGLSLSGADVLLHHSYELDVSYGFASERPAYNFAYAYDRFYPTFSLNVFDENNLFEDYFVNVLTGEAEDYWQRERGFSVGLSLPLYRRLKSGMQVGVSYFFDHINSLTSGFPYSTDEASVTGYWQWYFLERTAYALWPRRGFVFEVLGERTDARLGGDYDLTQGIASLQFYVPSVFKRHVLSLLAKGGVADGDVTDAFYLGGEDSLAEFRPDNDFYPLRGYPARAFAGNRFAFGQVEYGLPLLYIDRGLTSVPFYFDSLALQGFYEIGSAWVDNAAPDFKDSAGAELQSRFKLFSVPFVWNTGLVQGLRDEGETRFYMNLKGEF